MKRLLLALLLWAPGVAAQGETPATASAVELVRALELRRQAAMVAADTRTLSVILAEDATYAHSNGLVQSRGELFRALERGDIRYVEFTPEDVAYRAYGCAVVGTGVQRIRVESEEKRLQLRSRYTVVYVASDGDWKLVAYQSTPAPGTTPSNAK